MSEFNDDELNIIRVALYYYGRQRHSFANAIAQKGFIKQDGSSPTSDDVAKAIDYAKRVDDLVSKLANDNQPAPEVKGCD